MTASEVQKMRDQLQLEALMVLQVHDEIVFELPREELDVIGLQIVPVMQTTAETDLLVPVPVDLEYGDNWGEQSKWKRPVAA